MPAWLVSILEPVAEWVLVKALNLLEDKYPGIVPVVDFVKKILGSDTATIATPSALVDHLRKF